MRAVWSFWSHPFNAYKGKIWARPLHHMLAWGLSLHTARQHYPETVLITDTPGKRLLVDQLGLSFTEVSTELDRLQHVDIGWWALGKLVAYNLQDRPFLHIDSDVFLWKRLPQHLEVAPVVAQSPEHFHTIHDAFGPREIEQVFSANDLQLPTEWEWMRSRDPERFREENCGILGGCDIPFLRYYSGLAIDLATNPAHRPTWNLFAEKECFTMLIEQFSLAACIDFHRFHPTSPFRGVGIQYLFPTFEDSLDSNQAARVGFTHLLGGSKSHSGVGQRIEARMRRDDPAYFQRCESLLQRMI
ncbi:DUF6734 family protein [Granulicella sp. dw_53]|uniref:DUF6734 family protein n=1 Tax=Granulicella sp. dw_53 TaxID=2719792 RepID=UPI001BD2FE35|nr:DUF6734 family protein [Granulicella sp. dw_53]